jgi:hypothetical protein
MKIQNQSLNSLISQNTSFARRTWGLTGEDIQCLRSVTKELRLSVARGDLKLLEGHWYVTNSGLLRIARRNRCASMLVCLLPEFSEPAERRWVFRATVHKSRKSEAFVGYGDADPSNVSPLVRGAELRIAETRAVNRALRKAYGIGLCSVEELGAVRTSSSTPLPPTNGSHSSNGNGQPRLRDQLCLLIRQYNLDANLVKAYAADFCGTETLRGASRELVESFISHLSMSAKENRDALVCKLNSYAQPTGATS